MRSGFPPEAVQKVWLKLCLAFPVVLFFSIAAANILLGLIVLGWILKPTRLSPRKMGLPLRVILIYLAWTLVATAVSPFAVNGSAWFEERSTLLALIPGFVVASDERLLRRMFGYFAILLAGLALYSLYQYFFGWDLIRFKPLVYQSHRYHAVGFQNFHLTFAGMTALITPAVVGFFSGRSYRSCLCATAGLMTAFSAIARSIILGYIGCAALFAVFGSKTLRRAGFVIFLLLLVLPVTIYSAAGDRLAQGLGVSGSAEQQGDPTRIYLWKSALNVIRHHPLTGIGEANWDPAFQKYGAPFEHYSTTAGPHNDFLSAMVENGIIGGVLFIAMWLVILYSIAGAARRVREDQRDLLLGLLGSFLIILFAGLFQDYQTDAENALLLWFMVGIGIQLAGTLPAKTNAAPRVGAPE
jgi:O-antigen ligase